MSGASAGGLRRGEWAEWTRGQWGVRAIVALGPLLALLAALPHRPPIGLVVVVGVLSVGWAVVPESAAGAVVLVLVAAWWAIYVEDPLRLGLVGATAALVAAHLAAVVASYGPGRMAVEPALLRRWVLRGAAMTVPAPLVLLAVLALDGAPVPPGLWTTAMLATIIATGAAAVGLRRPGDAED